MLFKKFLKIRFSAKKSGSRLRCRTMLKIPWNTQKTPTKHALRLFKNFLKIRFSAQKSGSRPRCRTKLKILWNTQKTPTKHALRHFRKLLKIRFLAEKSGSRLRCRIMLKIPWNTQKTPTKRVLITCVRIPLWQQFILKEDWTLWWNILLTVRNIPLERSKFSFIQSNFKLEVPLPGNHIFFLDWKYTPGYQLWHSWCFSSIYWLCY